jgi:hypothetical protein
VRHDPEHHLSSTLNCVPMLAGIPVTDDTETLVELLQVGEP